MLEKLAEALDVEVPDLLELLADALRAEHGPATTQAIWFTLPGRTNAAPRATDRRIVQMLDPEEAATMVELGAFLLARKSGTQAEIVEALSSEK